MGLLIGACIVLCLFFLRDVFILGSKQEHVSGKLALYSILMSTYLLAAVQTVYSLPDGRALELLSSPWIWALTLAMHLGLWWVAAQLKRRPDGSDWMWWMVMTPAPMLILSIIATSHRLSMMMGSSNAFIAGVVASIVWIALVLIGVLAFRAAYRGWEDRECVADVAQIASWTGIGILPFTGVVEWLQVLLSYD
jgi:hypothetical protein